MRKVAQHGIEGQALPQNLDAERSVLGAILLSNEYLKAATAILKPTDFFLAEHRRIFKQMMAMGEIQQAIDLVTLTDELHRKGELEAAGGAAYLAELVDGVPKISNVAHYARIVNEKALLRKAIHAAETLQLEAFEDHDDADSILGRATETLAALRGNGTRTAGLISMDLHEFRTKEFPAREPLMTLDPHGTVVLSLRSINQIYAWRGTGKTMFTLGLAGALATGGKFLNLQATRKVRILYIEGETPNAQLQERSNLLVGLTDPGYFRIVSLDLQPDGITPLATAIGRKAVESALGDAEVLILDSLSTLAWIATNDEENWLDLLAWFARLRSRAFV